MAAGVLMSNTVANYGQMVEILLLGVEY